MNGVYIRIPHPHVLGGPDTHGVVLDSVAKDQYLVRMDEGDYNPDDYPDGLRVLNVREFEVVK